MCYQLNLLLWIFLVINSHLSIQSSKPFIHRILFNIIFLHLVNSLPGEKIYSLPFFTRIEDYEINCLWHIFLWKFFLGTWASIQTDVLTKPLLHLPDVILSDWLTIAVSTVSWIALSLLLFELILDAHAILPWLVMAVGRRELTMLEISSFAVTFSVTSFVIAENGLW